MGELLARATGRTTLGHIQHVPAVQLRAATGLVADVYRQIVRDFGMLAPPLALHAPAPAALAASWLMLRETLLATGRVDRATKEVVAAAVSLSNRCPYCVEVHGATLIGLSRDADASAVAADQIDTVEQPRLRSLAQWARFGATATAPRSESGSARAPRPPSDPAPFPPEHAPELIGVAVTFQYLNRMVNVFLQDSPFPPGLPAGARPRVRRVAAFLMRMLARHPRRPGESLALLAPAPLPPDLSWAAGQAAVAEAFARATAAIDAAGEQVVPDRVRLLVTDRLDAWDGRPPGISSRAWLDEATGSLPEPERAAGRLSLVTAFASYQATEALVDDFRRRHPSDGAVIELAAWASLAAARRIGRRLYGDGRVAASGAVTAADPRR